MSLQETPLSESVHIVFAGVRNSGKSSLINCVFEKDVSIVSSFAGTTTDPVTRKMELKGLGPVAITDTAGVDDVGEVGQLRISKTEAALGKGDVLVFVSKANTAPMEAEKKLLDLLLKKKKVVVFALTHSDLGQDEAKLAWVKDFPHVLVDNLSGAGVHDFILKVMSLKSKVAKEISPLHGLVHEGDLVVLVTPIDLAAPKGRLILPQVETIRDALDRDCASMILKERELFQFYSKLPERPRLVVTDSQAFHKVAADIPHDQALTSFSILFARKKGDLETFLRGISRLKSVPKGGKVLVMEACSHHRQADDIGTVKIPRLFRQLVQGDVHFDFTRQLPEASELKEYDLIIHCAGCMMTRNKMMERLESVNCLDIPITNYGLFLGWVNGLLPRAIEPFPEIYEEFKDCF